MASAGTDGNTTSPVVLRAQRCGEESAERTVHTAVHAAAVPYQPKPLRHATNLQRTLACPHVGTWIHMSLHAAHLEMH